MGEIYFALSSIIIIIDKNSSTSKSEWFKSEAWFMYDIEFVQKYVLMMKSDYADTREVYFMMLFSQAGVFVASLCFSEKQIAQRALRTWL